MGQGLAPTTLRHLRGTIASMTGCMRPGGCATTSIRMTFGADSDPHLYCRRQLFENWLYILDTLGEDDRALQLAWKKTVDTLTTTKHRWQRVKGTMAAVVATLLDLQWQPRAADAWADSDGEEFALRRCDRGRLLEYALKGAAEEAVWRRASQWHLGGGPCRRCGPYRPSPPPATTAGPRRPWPRGGAGDGCSGSTLACGPQNGGG